jgi:hypothetical protein
MKQIFAIALLAPLLVFADGSSDDVSRTRLESLGAAVRAYRMINGDKNPAKLSDLYYSGLVDDPADFASPVSGTKIDSRADIDAKTDYTLDPLPGVADLVVRENKPEPGKSTLLVALADGTVKEVPAPGGSAGTGSSTVAAVPPSQAPAPPPPSPLVPVNETPAVVPNPSPAAVPAGPPLAAPPVEAATPPPPAPVVQAPATLPSPNLPAETGTSPPPAPNVQTPARPPAPILPRRAYLGTTIMDIRDPKARQEVEQSGYAGATGLLVTQVSPGSPAAYGGIRRGDIIVAVGGRPVEQGGIFVEEIAQAAPGAPVDLTIFRQKQTGVFRLVLGVPPHGPVPPEFHTAHELFESKRYAEALAAYNVAVGHAPYHRDSIFERGQARLWLNDLHGALADWKTLAMRDPGDLEARRLRALMELLAGDRRAGLLEAIALSKVVPNNPQMMVLLGVANLYNGNPAAGDFARAEQRVPALSQQYLSLANTSLQAGVPAVAYLEANTALGLDPKLSGAYFPLGMAAAQLGDRATAVQALAMYLRSAPTGDSAARARLELASLQRR